MDKNDYKIIRITKFINPDTFWFTYKESDTLKNDLQNFLENIEFQGQYCPKEGETVAVLVAKERKWSRGLVLSLANGKWIIQTLDNKYRQICTSSWIRRLPSKFLELKENLEILGGINGIIPAEKSNKESGDVLVAADVWSKNSVQIVERILNNAKSVKFRAERKSDKKIYGSMEIKLTEFVSISVAEVLLSTNEVLSENNFNEDVIKSSINEEVKSIKQKKNVKRSVSDLNFKKEREIITKGKNLVTQQSPNYISAPTLMISNEQTPVDGVISKILFDGKNISGPCSSVEDAGFCYHIQNTLKNMRLNQPNSLQKYAWPNLMSGSACIFLIDEVAKGKTLAYLAPICSLVMMNLEIKSDTVLKGPVGIIVVPTADDVLEAIDKCLNFYANTNKLDSVYGIYETDYLKEKYDEIYNKCNILIITPIILYELITRKIFLFNNRLKYLVIDNVDAINKDNLDKIISIRRTLISEKSNFRVIITSSIWRKLFKCILPTNKDIQIFFGSYLEAAIYKECNMITKFVHSNEKITEVIDIIKSLQNGKGLVIVCNTDYEARYVAEVIQEDFKNIPTLCCERNSSPQEKGLGKKWHNNSDSILICTDIYLSQIKANSAKYLIHFSAPLLWTTFQLRFSVFSEYFENNIKSLNLDDRPTSLLLLNENEEDFLLSWINFLEIHASKNIQGEILNVSENILLNKETKKATMRTPFCPNILEMGKCTNAVQCKWRHILCGSDKSESHIPVDGNVKVHIINVLSATHYCVQSMDEDRLPLMQFQLKFSSYYGLSSNHVLQWPIKVGDLCTVRIMGNFKRCQVLETSNNKKDQTKSNVLVRLIDEGDRITCTAANLLVLPSYFHNFPSQAFELRLLGVKRFSSRNHTAIANIKKWLNEQSRDSIYFEVPIKFSLMNTIWAKNIYFIEQLKPISAEIVLSDLREKLLKENFVYKIDSSAEILINMSMEQSIINISERNIESALTTNNNKITLDANKIGDYDKSDSVNVVEEEKLPPVIIPKVTETVLKITDKFDNRDIWERNNWENLDDDKFCKIIISAFHSPDKFYVQKLINLEKLGDIYKEIDAFIEKKKVQIKNPRIGDNCIAENDGLYSRAKIVNIIAESEECFEVFFCDIGIFEKKFPNEIFKTTKFLVNALPYQAINCCFFGIKCKANNWPENIINAIYDDILDPCDDIILKCNRCINTIQSQENFGISKYEVTLFDSSVDPWINFNSNIVKKEYATSAISFENINPSKEVLENDDLNVLLKNIVSSDVNFNKEDIQSEFPLPPTVASNISTTERLGHKDDNKTPKIDIKSKSDNSHETKIDKSIISSKSEIGESRRIVDTNYLTNIMPCLQYTFKNPIVVWKQSKSYIHLKIESVDIIDYYLRVEYNYLKFTASINGERYACLINFFGAVEPCETIHNIHGLHVSIRLTKQMSRYTWPRLCFESDKYSWLRYDMSALILDEENEYLTRTFCDYENESPSESDEFNEDYENDENLNDMDD